METSLNQPKLVSVASLNRTKVEWKPRLPLGVKYPQDRLNRTKVEWKLVPQ